MNLLTLLALLGWVPCVQLFFVWLPPRRAIIVAYVVGWLFLPVSSFELQGIPEFDKLFATSLGAFLGTTLFDFQRLMSFRLRWVDLPMVIWCLCPLATSMTNGLGIYDGMSEVLTQIVGWGLPYLFGRLYFTDLPALRELAIGIFLGGLIYVPLCLFEIRMSPQLHKMVYGFAPRRWAGTRFGGWRPNVFLEHGLALGIWMTAASLVGVWLWASRAVTQLRSWSMAWLVPPLLMTTVLCKSAAALGLLVVGLVALFATRWPRTMLPMAMLILIPPSYVCLRATGVWDASHAVRLAQTFFPEQRVQSLAWRFRCENLLLTKAVERPLFGWGGWGRSRIYDEQGKDIAETDGLWIIAFGKNGLVGLVSFGAVLLLGPSILWWRLETSQWSHPAWAPAAAAAVLITITTNDCLLNGFLNPVFTLCIGALTGLEFGSGARSFSSAARPLRKPAPVVRRLWPAESSSHAPREEI